VELRPDQLEEIVAESPVAYWPLGLIEHHGWALPVGFDGVKAQRFCERLAKRTGGVVLPVMWWGSGGGHEEFKWTFYQQPDVGEKALGTTVRKLAAFGFRAVVVLAGHYPWAGILDRVLAPIRDEHPQVLMRWGTECSIGGADLKLPGDHASRWETAYGLALLPDLVDLEALRPGRGDSAWPGSSPPPVERRYPGVKFDPGDPLFAQFGEDPRGTASAHEAETYLGKLADRLVEEIDQHLRRT
jgi:creatinine amidohydrolase